MGHETGASVARLSSGRLSNDNYFLPSRQLYVEAIEACSKGLSICSSCRFAQK